MMRGVEDHAAFERGINNEMTSAGARQVLRVIARKWFPAAGIAGSYPRNSAGAGIQRHDPAQLPDNVEVAHKTGEISTHSHDGRPGLSRKAGTLMSSPFSRRAKQPWISGLAPVRKSRQPCMRSLQHEDR
jgi:hypothetical protein